MTAKKYEHFHLVLWSNKFWEELIRIIFLRKSFILSNLMELNTWTYFNFIQFSLT
jgi:hypothetical protein